MGDLPRVLFATFAAIPGPSGESARALARIRILGRSYDLDVVSAQHLERPHVEKLRGARLLRVPAAGAGFADRAAAFERALQRQIQGGDYDLVHFADPVGGRPALEQQPRLKYRTIYEPGRALSLDLEAAGADEGLVRAVAARERACFARADAVVLPGEAMKRWKPLRDAAPRRVRVVPASTDLALFQASQPPPGGGMVVAAACSLSPWEDVATLLDAVGRLPPHLGVRLVLSLASAAGPGESAGPADIPTQPRGTPGWVEVRPPLLDPADVAAMLAEADVVAVPLAPGRRNAEAGHTLHRIAEALAAGRALVAPDLPAVREAVDADTALLYPPGDAAALARALEELAADPDRRMDMGLKARERAEDRYADAVVAEPLLALYRELLEPSVMLAPELMGPAAPPSDGTHAFEDLTDPDATAHPVPFSGHLADDTTNKHRTAPPPPSFSGPLASDDTSRAVGSQPAAASPAPKLPRDEPDTDPASRVS